MIKGLAQSLVSSCLVASGLAGLADAGPTGDSRNFSGKPSRAFRVTGPLASFSFTRQNMWSRMTFCTMAEIIGHPDFQTVADRRLARRFMDGLRTFDLKFQPHHRL
jgi:hypothetical protein